MSLQILARGESRGVPALALAAEVKIPTAGETLIGTGRTDFTPYLIAGKSFGGGRSDVHFNVGYSFVGKPRNITAQNTVNLAFAVEHRVTPRLDLMGELLSTTAAGTGGPEGSAAPEIAGAEQVGMLGVRFAARQRTWLSLGITYDNTNAVLFRPEVTFESPF